MEELKVELILLSLILSVCHFLEALRNSLKYKRHSGRKCLSFIKVSGLSLSTEHSRLFSDLYGVCSFDHKQNRILSDYFEANDDMTIEKCLSICRSKEFPYSGLEYSSECYCGHAPDEGFEWAWPNKCNYICAGDSNQICGGSDAMSLWNTPPTIFNGYCVYDFPSDRRVLDDFSITGLSNLTVESCAIICEGRDF